MTPRDAQNLAWLRTTFLGLRRAASKLAAVLDALRGEDDGISRWESEGGAL